jgi:hypothetical protein
VQGHVIIPRIHVASNERGVDGESFYVGAMAGEKGFQAELWGESLEFVAVLEIYQNGVPAAILPGWDY